MNHLITFTQKEIQTLYDQMQMLYYVSPDLKRNPTLTSAMNKVEDSLTYYESHKKRTEESQRRFSNNPIN